MVSGALTRLERTKMYDYAQVAVVRSLVGQRVMEAYLQGFCNGSCTNIADSRGKRYPTQIEALRLLFVYM